MTSAARSSRARQPWCSALFISLISTIAPTSVASPDLASSTLALIGIVDDSVPHPGVVAAVGDVTKHPANPLLGPGRTYTSDNGYLSVVHEPSDPLGAYRMWYDASPTQRNCIAHANSSDGIHWSEPKLGLINVSGSTNNNCVVVANGLGVFRDPTEASGSPALFKAFGGIGKYSGRLAGHGGTMISRDGLRWESPVIFKWPDPPQRFDTSNNVFFDPATRRYVATTRRHPTTAASDGDRAIGIALSAVDSFTFNASSGSTSPPPLTLKGNHDHQLYAQETFKWHQLYMGIVMVYDATDGVYGRVHCRLAWSKDPVSGWGWVGPGGLTATPDFIPLGRMGPAGSPENAFDSYLCFASRPVRHYGGSARGDSTRQEDEDEERIYYAGSNGKHSGSKPHRNASVGLATLRPDGFAGMRGTGTVTTVPILCTGRTVLLTADTLLFDGTAAAAATVGGQAAGGGGDAAGGGAGGGSVSVNGSAPLAGNVTGAPVPGLDLAAHVGQMVVLQLELQNAVLYTVGFAPG